MAELTRTGAGSELVHTRRDGTPVVWPVAGPCGVARPPARRFSRRTTTSPSASTRGRPAAAQTELARVTRVTASASWRLDRARDQQPLAAISPTPAPASTGWTPTRAARPGPRALAAIVSDGDRAAESSPGSEPCCPLGGGRQPCRLAQIITDVPLVRSEFPTVTILLQVSLDADLHRPGRSHPAPAGAHQSAGQRGRGDARCPAERRGSSSAAC